MANYTFDGTVADFNTKFASMADGDKLTATAGATWASGVTISGKGVTIDLGGFTFVRGATSAVLFDITTDATNSTRLTNGTITQTTGANMIKVDGGFSRSKFRFDHLTLTTTASTAVLIKVLQSWGLIDQCTISGDDASEMIHNEAYGASSTTGWGVDVIPGSGDMLYVEDCTFSKYDQTDPFFVGTSALQAYYGALTVVRYCQLNYCQIDQHGSAGAIGARWWEFYENDFFVPTGHSQNQSNAIVLRAGSGYVYNNTKSGSGTMGANAIEMQEEDSGTYPLAYQVGRGKSSNGSPPYDTNQALDPAYFSNNWNTAKVKSGSGTYIQLNRDYYNTTKPDYTPYTYPNPIAIPADPSALDATAASSSSINLVWTNNTSQTAYQDGTYIERSPNGSTGWSQIGSVGQGISTYSDTGLTAATTYYYRVRAYNDSGNSGYSSSDSAQTNGATVATGGSNPNRGLSGILLSGF